MTEVLSRIIVWTFIDECFNIQYEYVVWTLFQFIDGMSIIRNYKHYFETNGFNSSETINRNVGCLTQTYQL